MNMILSNAETIEQELEWFQELILLRGKITFEQSVPDEDLYKLSIPSVENHDSQYARVIKKYNISTLPN